MFFKYLRFSNDNDLPMIDKMSAILEKDPVSFFFIKLHEKVHYFSGKDYFALSAYNKDSRLLCK